jgi:phage protein D
MRVTVKAAGEAFEGEYVAEAVTHRFSLGGGYTTEFLLKRNMSE